MPLTFFHVGPAILFGLLLLRYLDLPTFLVVNVVVDWRAALVVLGLWGGPRHGWMHTYLGALVFCLCLLPVVAAVRPALSPWLARIELPQSASKPRMVAAVVVGVAIHVTIDAFHHPLMTPFLPSTARPLYGLFSTFEMRVFTTLCGIVGFGLYLAHGYGVVRLVESGTETSTRRS